MVAIESQLESERLKRIHNIAYEIVIIMNLGVISRLQSSERRNHYIVKPYASGYDSGGGSRFSDKWGGGELGRWGGLVSKNILFGPSGLSLVKYKGVKGPSPGSTTGLLLSLIVASETSPAQEWKVMKVRIPLRGSVK